MKPLKWYHLLIPTLGFLGFMMFVLPQEAEKSAALGLEQSPDTSIFYTSDELYQIAENYGEEGREFYIDQRFSFDLIWPLAYGFFFVTLMLYGTQKMSISKFKYAHYLPLSAMLLDYIENIMTATVMYRYPQETIIISDLAGVITSLKWLTLSLAFIVLILIFIIILYQQIFKRRIKT